MQKTTILLLFFFILLGSLLGCHRNSRKQVSPAQEKRFKENLVKANRGLVTMDKERIESYVQRRNWDMETSKTGLWYEIYEHGNGPEATPGKIAHMRYQVSLLDGTVCYTSDSLGLLTFKITQGGVESGLEEAVLMMGVGDKGRFIMPPHLAHGLLGDENKIPPRSIIVYHAELLKLTDY